MADPQTERHQMAKEYDAIHNRLFVLQILVLALLLAIYQFSGASAALAGGLETRFGENRWWATNAVYAAVSVFGFAAFMSPFGFYSGYVLERHYGLSEDSVFDWLADFIKSLVIDLLIATVLFSVIYGFLRWIPEIWWVSAAAFYVLFGIILSATAPVLILPMFYKFEPLEEGELSQALRDMVAQEGIPIAGVFKWGGEDSQNSTSVALTGFGKKRRLVIGDMLLAGFTQPEILAMAARELGHHRHRDRLRLIITSSLLAFLGFFIAHHCLLWLTAFFGIPQIYDIGAAPIFIFSLFVFSLIAMPVANLHSRRREFAADAFAIRLMGSADPLVSAFEKMADQNLSNREPAVWVELLLHSHPSIARRIKRAREI